MVLKKCFGIFLFHNSQNSPYNLSSKIQFKAEMCIFLLKYFLLCQLVCRDNYKSKKVFFSKKIIQERIWFSNKKKKEKRKGAPKRLKDTKIYYIYSMIFIQNVYYALMRAYFHIQVDLNIKKILLEGLHFFLVLKYII